MELDKAVSQLAEIHAQVSRTEHYRGFRSITVALTGVAGLLAALGQWYWLPDLDARGFIGYWTLVAAANLLFAGGGLALDYVRRHTPFERRKTHAVLKQFLPALFAGLLLTVVALDINHPLLLQCLPGLWSLLFGLGVFACQPYFPTRLFWLGVFYLLAASWLFSLAPSAASLSPGFMGLIFGGGQLAAAAIIFWDVERHDTEGIL